MQRPTTQHLEDFYAAPIGQVTQTILGSIIASLWSDGGNTLNGLSMLACGYANPLIGALTINAKSCERFTALSFQNDASHSITQAICRSDQLPIESNSIDRLILMHGLEFSDDANADMAEIWRVLKSQGRAIIIVPNRRGLWARADWSPFGQGIPYSLSQLKPLIRRNNFGLETVKEALYTPPSRNETILKCSNAFERIGQIIPYPSGLHIIEISKELYARSDRGHGAKAKSRIAAGLSPKPALPYMHKKD